MLFVFILKFSILSAHLCSMPRGKYRQYDHDILMEAVQKVKSKELKAKQASRIYGIPRVTILNRVYNRVAMAATSSGPSSILTKSEEALLKQWIVDMGRMSFPITKDLLKKSVKEILDQDGRPNPFKDNFPGVLHVNANVL
jgi:hypothetical protein